MLANFGTNASGATWWSNFELIQVEPHTIDQFGTNASGILFSWRDKLKLKSQYPGSVVPLAMFLNKLHIIPDDFAL